MLVMGGEVETAQIQQVVDEVERTYEKFRTVGIGPVEFPIARKFYRDRILDELQKPESVAYMLIEARLNGWERNYVTKLTERISGQGRESVNEQIATHFPAFDEMLTVVVTPEADVLAGACVVTDIDAWADCD